MAITIMTITNMTVTIMANCQLAIIKQCDLDNYDCPHHLGDLDYHDRHRNAVCVYRKDLRSPCGAGFLAQ